MKSRLIPWIAGALIVAGILFAVVTPAQAIKKEVDAQQLQKLQSSGAWVVDVRTAYEYSSAHIPGAVNVPIDKLPQAAAGWNKNQAIVVYCATGARSANALAYLSANGFRKLYDLSGGMTAWNGQTQSGGGQGLDKVGAGTVKTNGKPVFIDFAGSA